MSCINRFLNIEAFSIPRIIKNFFSIVMVCFSFSVSKYQCFLKHHTCSFSPFNLLCSVWAILFTLMASATTKILLFPKSFSSSCISLLSSRAYIHLPVAHLHIFDHRNFKLQTCCVQDLCLFCKSYSLSLSQYQFIALVSTSLLCRQSGSKTFPSPSQSKRVPNSFSFFLFWN